MGTVRSHLNGKPNGDWPHVPCLGATFRCAQSFRGIPADAAGTIDAEQRTIQLWVQRYSERGTGGLRDAPRRGRSSKMVRTRMARLARQLYRGIRQARFGQILEAGVTKERSIRTTGSMDRVSSRTR